MLTFEEEQCAHKCTCICGSRWHRSTSQNGLVSPPPDRRRWRDICRARTSARRSPRRSKAGRRWSPHWQDLSHPPVSAHLVCGFKVGFACLCNPLRGNVICSVPKALSGPLVKKVLHLVKNIWNAPTTNVLAWSVRQKFSLRESICNLGIVLLFEFVELSLGSSKNFQTWARYPP